MCQGGKRCFSLITGSKQNQINVNAIEILSISNLDGSGTKNMIEFKGIFFPFLVVNIFPFMEHGTWNNKRVLKIKMHIACP